MKKKELYEMDIEEAANKLIEDNNCITTYYILLEFAKEQIDNQNIGFALHILNAIYNSDNTSDYYNYDYSMGTLENPTLIESLEDLEQFCDEE